MKKTNGKTNGITNGRSNGRSSGLANGMTNGMTNGVTNGLSNGQGNGLAQGNDRYRELLLAKQTELLSSLRMKLETLVGPENVASEDSAQLLHDQYVAIKVNQIDLLQLQLVTTALQRLDGDEDYGVCADCGDPISDRRLRVIPWTSRCLRCQGRLDSSQSEFHNHAQGI